MVLVNWMSSAKVTHALLILFFLAGSSAFSQDLERSGMLTDLAHSSQNNRITDGTLHIIAIMVEFEPDTNRFTSGDGTFGEESISYLQSDEITIDPLPHNKSYFEAHLEFAKNYYSRMSNGTLDIEYRVLDNVYRLPNEMEAYSPIGVDPSPEPLADLARDAWNEVAESGGLNLGLNPSDRIAFVLFHAGVGRDIELTGTILEKTPQDIPSVYLGKDAFARLFDDPSFSGFPIDNGNLLVDNTLILPRTLTRAGEDVTGSEVILQLSINGMVTAQIGSHIGLPDLFNTDTGESGIGRFGLMDGAGIFAYNGLFPPELSAWEKVYMGWAEPFTINYNDGEISLPASSLRQPNSIGKVPISSSEYFLIENRHREANQTGTTLTIQRPDGTLAEPLTLTNTDTSFVFQQSDFVELLEPGVVVDVSNYDFALPGGPADVLDETSDEDGRTLNGGILIWHIDEGIIQNRLAAREGINSNPNQRGVRLVEADGAQDIGRPTAIGFFQNEINGSAFDFWWSGNDASVITPTGTITLYENRFGPDTTPNNSSNSGARSAFELFEFSDNLPVAQFQIREISPGEDLYEVADFIQGIPMDFFTPGDDPYWSTYPLSAFSRQSDVYIPSNDGMIIYNRELQEYSFVPDHGYSSIQQPWIDQATGAFVLAPNPNLSGEDFTAHYFTGADSNTPEWEIESPANLGFISSPRTDFLQFDGTRSRATISTQILEEEFYSTAGFRSESIGGYESSFLNSGEIEIITPGETFSVSGPSLNEPHSRRHIGLVEHEAGRFHTFLLFQSTIILFKPGPDGVENSLIHSSDDLDWPALADFDGSGRVDFLFVDRADNELIAKNLNGAVLTGFPIAAPRDVRFTGTPLIADLNGDGFNEIIITGQNEQSINLYAYTHRGRLMSGFPLLVGGISNQLNDPVHPTLQDGYLTAVSHTGDLRVWHFPNAETSLWGSRYGNSGNNKLTGRLDSDEIAIPDFGILNAAETYNWPNPASDETFLRFQTKSAGEVQIRIATTSGRLIYDRTVQSRGSGPEEISIDTSGWGSGGYIAVVSATVNGQTERKLVKIAIAK